MTKKQFVSFSKNHILAIVLLALFFTISSLFWTTDIAISQADLKTENLNFGWPVTFVEQNFSWLDPPADFFPYDYSFSSPLEYPARIDWNVLAFSWTINTILVFFTLFLMYTVSRKSQPFFRFLSVKWIIGALAVFVVGTIGFFTYNEYWINQDFNPNLSRPPITSLSPPEVLLPNDIGAESIEIFLEEGGNLIVGDADPLERTFTEEHAYIKRYDYNNSTLWYVVNQRGQLAYTEPSNAAGNLITELDGKTASVVSESSFQNPPKDASVFLRIYDKKINEPTQSLIALSSNGKVLGTQTTPINKNYYNKYDMEYISNSNRLHIACSLNGNLVVLNLDYKIMNQSKEFRCSRSRAMRALSRDGTTVFYTEGLYEAYGLGEEEYRLMRKESKKLRAFSFTTGTSTVVAQEDGWLLYNSKNINTARGIYSQPIRRKVSYYEQYTQGFTFYQLPDTAFDFLTYEEVSKLPEVNSFEINKKWNIDETRFTSNGKTLVFELGSIVQGSARKEALGFYDIYKDALTFPLGIEDNANSLRLWQAPDKDNAFIITSRRGENREGMGGTTAMYITALYHIRRDGSATFIDSIPNLDGSISLLGTQ